MSYSFRFLDPSKVFKPGDKPVISRTNGVYHQTVMRKSGLGINLPCVIFKNRRSFASIPIIDLTDEAKAKLDKEHAGWRKPTSVHKVNLNFQNQTRGQS